MTDHDRLFKELISTFFLEFLELFLPDVSAYVEATSIEFLDKEIFIDVTSGERLEPDLVAKVRFKGSPAFFIIQLKTRLSLKRHLAGAPTGIFPGFMTSTISPFIPSWCSRSTPLANPRRRSTGLSFRTSW
jgi:hypothetical protein